MTTMSLTAIDGISQLRLPIAGSKVAKFRIRQTLYKANSPNINPTKISGYTVYTIEYNTQLFMDTCMILFQKQTNRLFMNIMKPLAI